MANVDLKTNFKNGDKLYDYELNNNFKAIQAALGAMNKIVWQNDDNASLVMFAGTTEQITNRELIEGQLLYNTQTGETYIDAMVDTELKRVSTGGGTSIQIGGIEPTNPATKLWVEDDELINVGSEIPVIKNMICPIGKVEVFFDNDDHSDYLGFTWERFGEGKVLVGINSSDSDFNTIGKTIGEKKHTLTVNEMPSHNHNYFAIGGANSLSQNTMVTVGESSGSNLQKNVDATGGGQAHNNIQPSIVVAFWKRVS